MESLLALDAKHRLHRRPGIDPAERDEILQEMQQVREDLTELAERMDFAERLLAKQGEGGRLSP